MKASLIVCGCIFLGAAACTAPQGKKLTANSGGLAPIAEGPPQTFVTLDPNKNGEDVSLTRNGKVVVTLPSAAMRDTYQWRLMEIPDSTVLGHEPQKIIQPVYPDDVGKEVWTFDAVGPGYVEVKLWYGDLRVTPLSGNPTFSFKVSVSEETKPVEKHKKSKAV